MHMNKPKPFELSETEDWVQHTQSPSISDSSSTNYPTSPDRKRRKSTKEVVKNEDYVEKRRKNNAAAKKSRDKKKKKDFEISEQLSREKRINRYLKFLLQNCVCHLKQTLIMNYAMSPPTFPNYLTAPYNIPDYLLPNMM